MKSNPTITLNRLKRHLFLALSFCVFTIGNAQSNSGSTGAITTIENLENVKVNSDKNVSNPDKIITSTIESKIQSVADEIHEDNDYEIMVVCVTAIDNPDFRAWGTELFNLWGIGDKETENGLLILVVTDARRVEFITGRGMESVLTDIQSSNIQRDEMIPWFKKGDYGKGILEGIRGVQKTLDKRGALYDSNPDDIYENESSEYASPPFYKSTFFIVYASFCGILTLVYFIFLFLTFSTKNLYRRYQLMKVWTLWIFAILAPIPFILLLIFTRKQSNKWRNMDRIGKDSGDLLHKLDDSGEDEHLNKGQLAEEVVESIDYDVWINNAGTDIVILSYKKWFSGYDKCSKCSFKTYRKDYDKTIKAATYKSSGTGEKKYSCKNCGHAVVKRYTISRKQKSSSRGYYSGGGGSFGGGGGGSFGGGGGSFGGGSSRGGGSGSSW